MCTCRALCCLYSLIAGRSLRTTDLQYRTVVLFIELTKIVDLKRGYSNYNSVNIGACKTIVICDVWEINNGYDLFFSCGTCVCRLVNK